MANEAQNDKISVIVPIYRVEQYLERCVKSVLAQTFGNWELILVDDGSPDASGAICDRFAAADPRIRVIHRENGGLSAARNTGIAAASGAFFAFLDADDFLAPEYLARLYDACARTGAEIAACGYVVYFNEHKKTPVSGAEEQIFTPAEAVRDIFTQRNRVHVVAWNKLYRRELFDQTGIRYPEGLIHEDVATTYALCAAANRVVYIPAALYYYTQREDSIVGLKFAPKRLQLLDAVESIRPFVVSHSPEFDADYAYYRFLNVLTLLNAMADSNCRDKALYRQLTEKMEQVLPAARQTPYFGRKHRITARLLRAGMPVFFASRALYRKLKK